MSLDLASDLFRREALQTQSACKPISAPYFPVSVSYQHYRPVFNFLTLIKLWANA